MRIVLRLHIFLGHACLGWGMAAKAANGLLIEGIHWCSVVSGCQPLHHGSACGSLYNSSANSDMRELCMPSSAMGEDPQRRIAGAGAPLKGGALENRQGHILQQIRILGCQTCESR